MKSFLVTLLIIGAIFLAYDYYLAPPRDRVVFERPPQTSTKPPQAGTTEVSKSSKIPVQVESPVAPPKPSSEKPRQSGPVVAVAPKPEPLKPAKTTFVPPRFDSIEVLTASWQKIPPSAFPRAVKLLKDTTFKVSVGSSVIRAGAEVVALKMDNGQLIVAPNGSSTVRQTVPVENTDLKASLVQLYEKWKRDRIEEARKRFEEELLHPKPVVADTAPAVDASGKPLMGVDGTYPLLLEQLRTGTPSEITPKNIIRWREPVEGTYKGKPTWTIEVTYKTMTMFGEMNIDSLVHIHNGKVVDWVYKGSGEQIP